MFSGRVSVCASWVLLPPLAVAFAAVSVGLDWDIQTLARGGKATGQCVSLAIDDRDCPHLCYRDEGAFGQDGPGTVWYARWSGRRWTLEAVDGGRAAGLRWTTTGIALADRATPCVAYFRAAGRGAPGNELVVASRRGNQWVGQVVAAATGSVGFVHLSAGTGEGRLALCGYADERVFFGEGEVGGLRVGTVASGCTVFRAPAAAVSRSGQAVVAFVDHVRRELWHAVRAGDTWDVRTLATDLGAGGGDVSLALDALGRSHMALHDHERSRVRYLRWDGVSLSAETVAASGTDEALGRWNALALDAREQPHILYYEGLPDPRVAHAWREGGVWRIERPEGLLRGYLYDRLAAGIDRAGRVHAALLDGDAGCSDRALRWAVRDADGWTTRRVDGSAPVGTGQSMAFDGLDRLHVCYTEDLPLRRLTHAVWDGNEWRSETVSVSARTDAGGTLAGENCRIAVGPDGQPQIVFSDAAAVGNLWHAQGLWGAWRETFLWPGIAGMPAMAFDGQGRTVVAFPVGGDGGANRVMVGAGSGAGWSVAAVADETAAGNVDLAVTPRGGVHLAFCRDVVHWDSGGAAHTYSVGYASYGGDGWRTETVRGGEGFVPGPYVSLAVDGAGRAYVGHHDARAGGLRCSWWDGSQWVTETIDADREAGRRSSLAADALGRIHACYASGGDAGDLRYAVREGGSWRIETVQRGVVRHPFRHALAVDSSGAPHVLFGAETGELRLASTRAARVGTFFPVTFRGRWVRLGVWDPALQTWPVAEVWFSPEHLAIPPLRTGGWYWVSVWVYPEGSVDPVLTFGAWMVRAGF